MVDNNHFLQKNRIRDGDFFVGFIPYMHKKQTDICDFPNNIEIFIENGDGIANF